MAKFLNTPGVSYYLAELISSAKESIHLVSPYLQINDQIKLHLKDACSQAKKISIVYGKNKEANDLDWLQSTKGIDVHFYDTLHAKCYMNEKEAILTSMNLYMFSQQNNCEMGIHITKQEDATMYEEVRNEMDRILRNSEKLTNSTRFTTDKNIKIYKKIEQHYGYCIRTGVQINFNPEQPMSYKAFCSWAQFSDGYYEEKFCHYSGERSHGETSYNYPILKKNWNEAKRKFNL